MLRDSASRAPRPLYLLGYICDWPFFLIVVWTQRCSPTHLQHQMKCLKLFQEYQQEFQIIAASLEACNWLSTINQDDSFYMGLPKTFRKKLKSELQVQRLWTDLSSLPEMCCVVQ